MLRKEDKCECFVMSINEVRNIHWNDVCLHLKGLK